MMIVETEPMNLQNTAKAMEELVSVIYSLVITETVCQEFICVMATMTVWIIVTKIVVINVVSVLRYNLNQSESIIENPSLSALTGINSMKIYLNFSCKLPHTCRFSKLPRQITK